MSSGLPIVATDVGSIAEYVSPSMGEIVPVGDVNALAAALDRVVSHAGTTTRTQRIARRFEWRNTVKALVASYRVLWPETS
jgi:glycosyltransferase involved in cell wall biosynthesis